MRRIALVMALAACEPEETGGSVGSSSTAADDGTEESSGSESSSEGSESTGEPLPDCLTVDGDPCSADGVCWEGSNLSVAVDGSAESLQGTGSVCIEPCSQSGVCESGVECRTDLSFLIGVPATTLPNGGCVRVCQVLSGQWAESCDGTMDGMVENTDYACAKNADGAGICVWPD